MLIDVIYKKLKEIGIHEFVFETDIIDQLPFKDEVVHTVHDVRSATFYACGLAQQKNTSVALFVRKEYLPSTHTGLTEAWFQNRHIIVIAFGTDILNDDLNYLKTCTCSRLKIQTDADVTRYIQSNENRTLPELFLVEDDIEFGKSTGFTDSIDVDCLPSVPDKLYVYERFFDLFESHQNIVKISERDKYGSISKYMGFCVASEKTSLLVIDDSILLLDINILNNRYMNKRFKVMVIGDMDQPNVLKWLDANHISFFEDSDPTRAICRLIEMQTPAIAFVQIPSQRLK